MSADDTGLIPYINDLLTNSEEYSCDELEDACSALLVLENRIREANYDEVLDKGVTIEEFEQFFTAKLEEQGRHWKIEKVRNMIEMEEEENDTK